MRADLVTGVQTCALPICSIPEGRCVKKSKYSRLINALKRELLAPPLLDDPPFAARRVDVDVGIANTNRIRRHDGCSETWCRHSNLAASRLIRADCRTRRGLFVGPRPNPRRSTPHPLRQ